MIREVGESIGRTVLEGIGRASSRVQERKALPVDLLESEDAYLAVFDAPGASAGDVNVELVGRTLEVDIERFRGLHDGYDMRFPGRGLALHGEVELPEDADVEAEAADATVTKNGTLEVLIPKGGADSDDESVDVTGGSESADANDSETDA
ncbi:Hsp20 family protein [Natronomonas amylolytica]|uniref:Hsp20 family protein n=1 Tax=Natronomonas amylolytica TaxID=3108498 RepID=UPI00300BABF7